MRLLGHFWLQRRPAWFPTAEPPSDIKRKLIPQEQGSGIITVIIVTRWSGKAGWKQLRGQFAGKVYKEKSDRDRSFLTFWSVVVVIARFRLDHRTDQTEIAAGDRRSSIMRGCSC
jgi:hypothetical protein